MGVQGLWELLAPVGRRVSVEALSGRKLAIDASIWIIQFMKAMRDEKGDMIRNAHLLGFFRRICKLLYLRAKPVFVFDGGTPALKRRTVIARRRQREQAQSKIRKTAEKLLLNHLRTRKLEEIAQNIGPGQSMENVNIESVQSSKEQGKVARSKGNKEKEVSKFQDSSEQQPPPLILSEPSTDNGNGKWTVPLVSEVDGDLIISDGEVENASDDSDDSNEEYFMPPIQGCVDPAVLASLPPSMQLNLLVQMREQLVTDNRKKFQKVAKNPASFSQMQIQAYLKTVAFRRDINEVQKAAAGKGIGGIPSARIASEVDREYIFSTTFEPEQQAVESDKGETLNTSTIYQDNLHTPRSKESQERLSERVDIDQSAAIAERLSSQKSSPKESQERLSERVDNDQSAEVAERLSSQKSSPKENNSFEDNVIEWEDGDEVVSLKSQPIKGVVITIEIDQDDLLAEGIEVQKLRPDNGSEDEDIEWEDEAVDCMSGIERQDANGDHMDDSDIGTGSLGSNRMSAGSTEIVDKTLMEIEATELEEAIRQSLQDHTGRKAPKLVIREESTMELKQNELLPPDFTVTEAPVSEEAFLARERERKGKAIVDDDRAVGESGTLTLKVKDLDQVSCLDSGYPESCNPEVLLKEAEEVDLIAEREAFAKQERDFLAERDELSRQQAELQAEMEAEQAAMQANLQEERDLLLQEEMELRATQRKNERNAESVTGEMFSECQELLQMFGLPYIIAPMEAEAQCAYMDSIGLIDGVVTEDSDVFLFGGRNVFKNIFDDRKYVETYYMKDVESELGLDQEKLIHMALLLGSDYTEGISGIGIVNAIEVVNAFEGDAGLQKFKDWLDAPDFTLLNKVQQDGQKKQTKKNRVERENEAEDKIGAEEPEESAKEGSQTAKYNPQQQDFIYKHRAVSKNWNVPESFPNPMVINAYISPQVDKSSESFMWGRPDLEALRRMCLERFGWNKNKSDELLLPVLKEYDRHETQLRLEAFYTFNQRFAKIRSKRIQKAVTSGTGHLSSELVDFPKGNDSESSSPTRRKARDLKHKHDACDEPELPPIKACSNRTPGPKRTKKEAIQGEKEVATRGRGRGRGRTTSSRGKATASKRSNTRLSTEASLSNESSSEETLDLDDKERMDGVCVTIPRRSSRLPQRAVYNFSGSGDNSDSDLGPSLEAGGSPGDAGSTPPSEVKEPVSRAEEANLSKDVASGSVGDVVNDPYGLQGQKDEEYLAMGGGFCMTDDINQEQPMGPVALGEEKEDPVPSDNSNFLPEGSAYQDTPLVGSNGEEPRLHAVPFLRRKKRRMH